MNKAAKYAINGAIFAGIANALLNTLKQFKEMEESPSQEFSWKRFFIAAGKGAAVGGAGGFVVGAIVDHQNALEKPKDTDVILAAIISDMKLEKGEGEYVKLNKKADRLSQSLASHFNDQLKFAPLKGGSTENGTALRDKFDIDIFLPFKYNGFGSTRKMFYGVLSFLEENKSTLSIAEIKEQKKSIGVYFDFGDKQHKVDVVPYKVTKGNSSGGYLFLKKKSFLTDDSSFTKTDIYALNNTALTKTQKDIVVILKNWKLKNELPLSSHLLVNLVQDAYEYNEGRIPRGLTKKTVMVLQHIADNLRVAVIRSVENSNNVITNIPEENKDAIINACEQAIEDYKYQPNSIVENLGKN
jgi:hypothetical protein